MTDETGYNHPTTLSTGSLEDADLEIPDSITEAEIADEAVTEPKIADDAVTENKIVALAVTAGKIAAGAITTAKLAADAVIAYVLNVGNTVTIDEDGISVIDGAITVVNGDGWTVIDGTSKIFQIYAEGTQNATVTTATITSTTLTGLGALDASPASVLLHATANLSTSAQYPGHAMIDTQTNTYVSTTAGGSPTTQRVGFNKIAHGWLALNGSNQAVVTLHGVNTSGSPFDAYQKYFVLQEAGF